MAKAKTLEEVQAQKEFDQVTKRIKPKQPIGRNVFWAFVYGGAICAIGQGINNIYAAMGFDPTRAGARTAVTVIFLGAFLTGIGVYDELGKRGGAGAAIPISGFANTIVSPSMEYRREGLVLGVAAQMFTVAGPVIVYGVTSALIVAAIRWVLMGGIAFGG